MGLPYKATPIQDIKVGENKRRTEKSTKKPILDATKRLINFYVN